MALNCGYSVVGLPVHRYKCPLCSMSIVDMSAVFSALETEIMMTPMPAEYANSFKHILCNDCHMVVVFVLLAVGRIIRFKLPAFEPLDVTGMQHKISRAGSEVYAL
jgi:hypothetical protein